MSEHKQFLAQYGTKDHVNKLASDPEPYIRRASMTNMTNQERSRFLDDPEPSVRGHLAKIGSDAHHARLKNDSNANIRATVAQFGNHSHALDLAEKDDSPSVHNVLARRTNSFDPEGKNDEIGSQLLKNKNLDNNALTTLSNGQFGRDNFHKILNHPSATPATVGSLSDHATGSKIDDIIDHEHNHDATMRNILRYKEVTPEQMHKMIDSPKSGRDTRLVIAKDGNDSHRDKIINHPDLEPVTMSNLAIYGNDSHREKLFNHPFIKLGSTLRHIAYGSEYGDVSTKEHIERAKRMLRGEE